MQAASPILHSDYRHAERIPGAVGDAAGAAALHRYRSSFERLLSLQERRFEQNGSRTLRPIAFADGISIMPLKNGSTQSVVSSNIKTLVDEWKSDGSIGTSHPASKKKAIRQAVAIALTKAGKSRKG